MTRIQKAYEARFRVLLARAGARRLEEGVRRVVLRAERLCAKEGISRVEAFTRLYHRLVTRMKPACFATAACEAGGPKDTSAPLRFFCDSGLGGLARWLRGAGFEAFWEAGIDDSVLLSEARKRSAIILTTDSGLMERRLLRDGLVPGLWLPPALGSTRQLAIVLHHFDLAPGPSRCMACGGELRRADKESLRDRIPPRTYRWRDEYFLCSRCGKLFWHGTHWHRIRAEIVKAAGSAGAEL